MLITKTSPVGIDWYIQQFQTALHNQLMAAWDLDVNDAVENAQYECYGRAYRNRTDNGYIAEVYTGSNQYKEVYWNDQLTAISFFGLAGSISNGPLSNAEVHLVFFVNLSKIKPAILHRADEEVRTDVERITGRYSYGFVLNSTELWLQNILKEYPGSRRDDRLKYVDMHPVHCFRMNFSISYDSNKNC
jgi:hypothetical protein